MARHISPAMRPYIELQRSLPKDTPFSERGRAARELKMQLAGRRAEEPSYHRRRSRRNPRMPGWVLPVALGLGGLWLYERRKQHPGG